MKTPSSLPDPRARSTASESGFTLVELLVTLGILLVVVLGVLAMFDLNSRIARTQTHLAEMQQSQRVAQQSILKIARMAGRGGLPVFDAVSDIQLPAGVALGVANNVASNLELGGCACAQVLPGTDVLTVRGVFSAPIFLSDPLSTTAFTKPGTGTGSLVLGNRTPTGAPQPLDDLARVVRRAQAGNGRDALVMVNTLGEYVVVEITGGSTTPGSGSPVTQVQVSFVKEGGQNTTPYNALSFKGAYPDDFGSVAYAGILEEYRFYVRDRRANTADADENVLPQLARARFFPNTDVAYLGSDANLTEIVADNILDLQVALGVDRDGNGAIAEGGAPGSPSTLTKDKDEWLFNDGADNPDKSIWNVASRDVFYVRVNTLARTDRPTPQYEAALLDAIEDNDYTAAPFNRFNLRSERLYHRRVIRSIIDLRNL